MQGADTVSVKNHNYPQFLQILDMSNVCQVQHSLAEINCSINSKVEHLDCADFFKYPNPLCLRNICIPENIIKLVLLSNDFRTNRLVHMYDCAY